MTILEWVATLTLSLTVGSVLVKLAFTFIDLKLKVKQDDFVSNNDLERFCAKAQARCPKLVEMSQFAGVVKQIQDTQKEVVKDQKILRQSVLVKEYVRVEYFHETVERIEKANKEAIGEVRIMVSGIDKKLDDMKTEMARMEKQRHET